MIQAGDGPWLAVAVTGKTGVYRYVRAGTQTTGASAHRGNTIRKCRAAGHSWHLRLGCFSPDRSSLPDVQQLCNIFCLIQRPKVCASGLLTRQSFSVRCQMQTGSKTGPYG